MWEWSASEVWTADSVMTHLWQWVVMAKTSKVYPPTDSDRVHNVRASKWINILSLLKVISLYTLLPEPSTTPHCCEVASNIQNDYITHQYPWEKNLHFLCTTCLSCMHQCMCTFVYSFWQADGQSDTTALSITENIVPMRAALSIQHGMHIWRNTAPPGFNLVKCSMRKHTADSFPCV